MVLCLDFKIKSAFAARILTTTAENFRQLLSRAKADLFQFMDNKCGLINPANPCRCSKKTKGLIQDGLVDVREKKFTSQTIAQVHVAAPQANQQLDQLMEGKYLHFFLDQPYEQSDERSTLVNSILFDEEIKDVFRLN